MSKKQRASRSKNPRQARRTSGVTEANKIARLQRHLKANPDDKQTKARLAELTKTGYTPTAGRKSMGIKRDSAYELRIAMQIADRLRANRAPKKEQEEARANVLRLQGMLNVWDRTLQNQMNHLPKEVRQNHILLAIYLAGGDYKTAAKGLKRK